jgi:CheY-like chemotaxis protein
VCFVQDFFKGRTALVVEDDWLLREEIVGDLRLEGWTVLEAGTGAGALMALREADARKAGTIDLLVTDVKLADALTGWDVAEVFRATYPGSAVIYSTGNPVNDSRCVKHSKFLSKPTTTSQIMLAYRNLVGSMSMETTRVRA